MKLLVIGNLVEDAIVNNINGYSVIAFNLEHIEYIKDSQGNQKVRSTIIACSYWTDKILVSPLLKKGVQVSLEGTPNTKITMLADSINKSSLTLKITSIQLLGTNEANHVEEFYKLLNQ
jgi:single-stranded DNA-binding protein